MQHPSNFDGVEPYNEIDHHDLDDIPIYHVDF